MDFHNYFSPKFLSTSFKVREINIDFAKENNYIYIYICCLKCVIFNFVFKHGSNIFLYGKMYYNIYFVYIKILGDFLLL